MKIRRRKFAVGMNVGHVSLRFRETFERKDLVYFKSVPFYFLIWFCQGNIGIDERRFPTAEFPAGRFFCLLVRGFNIFLCQHLILSQLLKMKWC